MRELLFHIDPESPVPRYVQVYRHLKNEIMQGRLLPDAKLPSIRNLAASLDLSRNTAQLAYEQLLAEGFIRSVNKKGYYVEPLPLNQALPPNLHQVRTQAEEEAPADLIDFRLGAVDPRHFPIEKWRLLSNRALKDPSIYTYGDRQGDPLLRQSIADYLFQSRGVQATAAQMIVGSSTQQLMYLLGAILGREFDSVGFEEPGYAGAKDVFRELSYHIEPVPVDPNGVHLPSLRQIKSRLLYVTPSHQFPLGMIMPIQHRLALLNWAEEHDGYIIEDDYDSEFRYKQKPVPAMFSLNNNERVIYVGTFSKALLPSVRIGYLILPHALLPRYENKKQLFEPCASGIHQRTLHYFMEEGYFGAHIKKMRSIYKNKMAAIKETVRKYAPPFVQVNDMTMGLHVILTIQTDQTEDELIKKAALRRLKVYKASMFYETPKNDGFVQLLLGFAGLAEEDIVRGLKMLLQEVL
ncbi:PLP-dependent aminotransferase family protein [Paenibacillus sp. VCA1]|uniref:MocR-like pyridoxine biosynthesis transcription factor PdxR n=1 Tax=Paenibacillus sp. VCA1 TaxID=3039148 RepID=UPI0028720CDB|nr:PLP-dependent aminotransferase family protein [Paenibacillus sp. VCA1]MDR9852173.1 PLP-dependent aminotransferase family protein [Paenibacillus sp. VCA1]